MVFKRVREAVQAALPYGLPITSLQAKVSEGLVLRLMRHEVQSLIIKAHQSSI